MSFCLYSLIIQWYHNHRSSNCMQKNYNCKWLNLCIPHVPYLVYMCTTILISTLHALCTAIPASFVECTVWVSKMLKCFHSVFMQWSCNDVYRFVFVPFPFLLHSVFSFYVLGMCTVYSEVRTQGSILVVEERWFSASTLSSTFCSGSTRERTP